MRPFLLVGITLVLIGIVGALYSSTTAPKTHAPERVLTIADTNVVVEVADTAKLRAQGLSGRGALPEGHGMLFVFGRPDRYGFWMKDMRFNIDIIWIRDAKVIGMLVNVTPESFPEVFYPPAPVDAVLELPAGSAARRGITEGSGVIAP